MSKIQASTLADFVTLCAMLVREGVQFRAYSANLTIELTGGF